MAILGVKVKVWTTIDDCFEGGPMTREEAEAFEALPAFSAILAMRDWDDKAKVRPSSSSIIVSMRDK